MILLDTHIWLRWQVKDADPLPEKLESLIDDAVEVGVSAVSCWEVAYLHKRNRLELPVSISDWINAALDGSGLKSLPLRREIAIKAALLPDIHRDPIDRFIIAEAIVEKIQLISLDARFSEYSELKPFLIQ